MLATALLALTLAPAAWADPSDIPTVPAAGDGPSAATTPNVEASTPTPTAEGTPTPPDDTAEPAGPTSPTATPTDDPGAPTAAPSSPGPTEPPEPSLTPQPTIAWTSLSAPADRSRAADATAVPVTVRTVCGGAIFANGSRRDAVVGWGDFAHGGPDEEVTVPAGRAVAATVGGREFDWAARWSDDGEVGEAGRGDAVRLPAGCTRSEPAAALTAVVSAPCLARRQPVSVLTTGRIPRGARWQVAADDNPLVLDHGPLESGRPLTVDLTRFGAGRYVLSLLDGDRVLDATTFSVQDCVTVQLSCRVADWTNPSGNTAVTVAFRTGAAAGRAVRLPPGASTRLSLTDGLAWSATGTAVGGALLSDAGSDVVHRSTDGSCDDPPVAAASVQSPVPAAAGGAAVAPVAPVAAAPAGSVPGSTPWLALAALTGGSAAALIGGAAIWLRRRAQ